MSGIEYNYSRESCVFCELSIMQNAVSVRRRVVDFEPLNPVTPGHRLFAPRMHVLHAADIPEVTGLVMTAASEHAKRVGLPFNLITSGGEVATQSVMHLHIHYVPRREGDGLHLPWTGQAEREGRA